MLCNRRPSGAPSKLGAPAHCLPCLSCHGASVWHCIGNVPNEVATQWVQLWPHTPLTLLVQRLHLLVLLLPRISSPLTVDKHAVRCTGVLRMAVVCDFIGECVVCSGLWAGIPSKFCRQLYKMDGCHRKKAQQKEKKLNILSFGRYTNICRGGGMKDNIPEELCF